MLSGSSSAGHQRVGAAFGFLIRNTVTVHRRSDVRMAHQLLPPFNREFTKPLAHDFYESVRCGVLHEARTKNGWTISAKSKSGTVVEPNLKIVYRDNFQSALLDFVEWYKRELPSRRDLHEAFLRKFNSLCT